MARLAGGSRAKQGIRTDSGTSTSEIALRSQPAAGAAVWITIVNSK